MNAKSRIKRIENATKPKDQIKFIWLEQDENGNFPPIPPGSEVIKLTWDQRDNRDAETLPDASE